MNNYNIILQKIETFTRKFYTNELIKGVILFLSLGLLYLLFTLFVEYFLWLKPLYRTLLFWLFVLTELVLLYRFILLPVFKLLGLKHGINHYQASNIIGQHFPEVDDKLLNMLQLHQSHPDSELVAAGIERKALQLKPIPFQNAIDFKGNQKYLKYLLIPIFIWLITYVSGINENLLRSYNRLVHHQENFIHPSPFEFHLINKNLNVIEGNNLQILVTAKGNTIPEEAYIVIDSQPIYLNRIDNQTFSYTFSNVLTNTTFYFQSDKVVSKPFEIKVLHTPQIQQLKMLLHYPSHISKPDESIENSGNATLPEGTQVTWQVKTNNTSEVVLSDSTRTTSFTATSDNLFVLSKSIRDNFDYNISTSNSFLKKYENLPFTISVIKDAFPQISIETDIDSLKFGEAHFVGRLSDDYGLTQLLINYYPVNSPDQINKYKLPVKLSTLSDFVYTFPQNLHLNEGTEYEFYFEVFDNDKINGFKSTKSKTYRYHQDSETQLNEKLLEQQQDNIKDINQLLNKQDINQKDLDQLQNQLQNKNELQFNDKQQIQQLMQRQQQYEQMMQRKTEELKQNFEKHPDTQNELLNRKKNEIQKRLDELKQSEEQKKILEELQKLAEKLKKEDLLDRMKRMSTNNKQQEKSLEQLLELTKRFYVEQKAQQISEKLNELAKKQDELKDSNQNNKEQQDALNKEFEKIQEDIQQMMQQNKELKKPMDIDPMKPEQESVKQDMQQASDQLQNQQKSSAKSKQQAASKKMRQMSQSMQQSLMNMQGEALEEDIETLRRIVKNLITFSYNQEDLMQLLSKDQQSSTNLSNNLKKQNQLKTYFQYIDDSLYTLAMRQPLISKKINDYLADAHFYLNETESSLSEAQIPQSRSQQQYVMTASNNLAALLSNMLDNLQNQQSLGMGQGQGNKNQPDFGLPDIIQKQGDLQQKMQSKGKSKSEDGEPEEGENGKQSKGKSDKSGQDGHEGNQGKNANNAEQQSQDLYELYQQQSMIREALEKQLDNLKGAGLDKETQNVLQQMEQLEKLLIEKGITQDVLQRLNRMQQDLLKLKNAAYDKGLEEKRISNTNKNEFNSTKPKAIDELIKKLNQQELLNREPLPFQPTINQKVIEYFQNNIAQ